jgi:hypothetical protein
MVYGNNHEDVLIVVIRILTLTRMSQIVGDFDIDD